MLTTDPSRPVATPADPVSDGAGDGDRGPVQRRILVVDDEPGIRLVLGRGLARYEYKVFLADSGQEALRLLGRELDVDAVVTDITMPTMSGIELAAEILHRHPGVPILFVTGSSAPAALLANPLIDLVAKPVRIAHVRDRLGELIDRAQAAAGSAPVPVRQSGPRPSGSAPVHPSGSAPAWAHGVSARSPAE